MSKYFLTLHSPPQATKQLICFHHAGGAASFFRNWTAYIGNDTEVIALQLPGRENRFNEKKHTDLPKLIEILTKEIQTIIKKPYSMFGHSLGALIAFELIHSLQSKNYQTPALFMPSGHRAPPLPRRSASMHDETDINFIRRLKDFEGLPKEILDNIGILEVFMPMLRADFQLADTYVYDQTKVKLKCPIHAFTGTQDSLVNEIELNAWKTVTDNSFSYTTFDGGHFYIKSFEQLLIQDIQKCNSIFLK